jgi:hypothetical protein
MSKDSPDSGSIKVGTVDKGARSVVLDEKTLRWSFGRAMDICGGDEDMICVEEVGTGVG